jgi:hypothetical protein
MKLLLKYFFIDVKEKKTIPPAKMIGQNQYGRILFNFHLTIFKSRKIFFDDKLDVPREKAEDQIIFSRLIHFGKLQKIGVNCKFFNSYSPRL